MDTEQALEWHSVAKLSDMRDDESPAISDAGSPVLDVLGDLDGIPIPRPIMRNFFRAIGHLIMSAADIPAAKFEAIAQGIRTEADAKSVVALQAARAAGRKFGEDANLAGRALQAYGGRIVGEQANREAVAKAAVEELRELPPPEHEPKEVDNDWLYRFSRYAEGVSNEEMQRVWGRVLAHQAAGPGVYSIRALSTLAVMDHDDAKMLQLVVNHLYDLDDGRCGVIAPYQHGTNLGKKIDEWWRGTGVTEAIEHLETLGLTRVDDWMPHLTFPHGTTEMNISISGTPIKVRKQRDAHPDAKTDLGPHYEMARLGSELRQLIRLETQPEYIRNLFAALSNKAIEVIPLDNRGKYLLETAPT